MSLSSSSSSSSRRSVGEIPNSSQTFDKWRLQRKQCSKNVISGLQNSIEGFLEDGVRALELPIYQLQRVREIHVGSSAPGRDVCMLTPGNPTSAKITDWLEVIANFSRKQPDHDPIVVYLNAKNDEFTQRDQLQLKDFTGGFPHLIDIVQAVFSYKLFTPQELTERYNGAWPKLSDLQGRIVVVLTGNSRTREHFVNDRGFHPAITCMRSTRAVVSVHDSKESKDGVMWFWSGRILSSPSLENPAILEEIYRKNFLPHDMNFSVRWDRHSSLNLKGINPFLAVNDNGWLVMAHERRGVFSRDFCYVIGCLFEQPSQINPLQPVCLKLFSSEPFFPMITNNPAVAITNTNLVLVVYCDRSMVVIQLGTIVSTSLSASGTSSSGSDLPAPFSSFWNNQANFTKDIKYSIEWIEKMVKPIDFVALGPPYLTMKNVEMDPATGFKFEIVVMAGATKKPAHLMGRIKGSRERPLLQVDAVGGDSLSQAQITELSSRAPGAMALLGDQPIDWPLVKVTAETSIKWSISTSTVLEPIHFDQVMFLEVSPDDKEDLRTSSLAKFAILDSSRRYVEDAFSDKITRSIATVKGESTNINANFLFPS